MSNCDWERFTGNCDWETDSEHCCNEENVIADRCDSDRRGIRLLVLILILLYCQSNQSNSEYLKCTNSQLINHILCINNQLLCNILCIANNLVCSQMECCKTGYTRSR
ncbi:hypothetical protein [Clostridium sp.]|uniref:hypothetical protein n=1 Tax=Clostridium sp. TaxID=1506 RepID=UPI0032162748